MKPDKLILIVLLAITAYLGAGAQNLTPLPVDPHVRYGKLPNGLTYYIRHNNEPKERACFYIALNVGSMQEEESQRGLAHFLEHMAFNGTAHFPGKSMLNYLESVGLKFGVNINGRTGRDETVYRLTDVPVREGIIDSCLLILHDWSSQIALEEKEIDAERGVIVEEYRARRNAITRMQDSILPVIYSGSRYASRTPIGRIDVLQRFSYKELRNFYKKWYRPDLQGIIVVGDIDVDQIEKKINELFGPIALPENPAERIYYPVQNNEKPIVAIAKDKEASNTTANIFLKHEPDTPEIRASVQGIKNGYIRDLISNMFYNRLYEISQEPKASFIYGGVYDGTFLSARTKYALCGDMTCKEGKVIPALTEFIQELERVDRYGFTPTEFQRAVARYQRIYTDRYNERDKKSSNSYVQEYLNHFKSGSSISGIENEYKIVQQLTKQVTLDEVNLFVRNLIKYDNVTIVIMGPDKEGLSYPSEPEVLAAFENGVRADLKPYIDKVINEPLVSDLLPPGKIINESPDKNFDATVWKLSNGATVIVKPTDDKTDEISMRAYSPGGITQFSEKEAINAKVLDVACVGGKGKFKDIELGRVLDGKKVYVSVGIGETDETVAGLSTSGDLETMMQLTYLSMTSPRKDVEAFEYWKEKTKANLKNRDVTPATIFSDSVNSAVYGDNPFATRLKADDIDKVDYDKVLSMYKECFADASGFTFVFVGNIHTDTLRQLVEKYIASLPATMKNKAGRAFERRRGIYKNNFERPMETPKSNVNMYFSGTCKYNYENALKLDILTSIVQIVFTRTIREQESGTYSVFVGGRLIPENGTYSFSYSFITNNLQEKRLKKKAYDELMNVVRNGPSQDDFDKVVRYMLKEYEENQKYTMEKILSFYTRGNNWNTFKEIVQKQTPETIRKFAGQLFDQKNETEVTMTGTKK